MPMRPEAVRDKLLPYVHQLLGLAQLGADGGVTWRNAADYRMSTAVVSGYLRRVEYRREDEMLLMRCVPRALMTLKRQGQEQPTWEGFLKAVRGEIARENARPCTKRLLLFLLHLQGPWLEHKRAFNVLDMRFRLRSWAWVKGLQGWKQFLDDARVYARVGHSVQRDLVDKFTPLVTEVHSRTPGEAIGLAERKFEVVRAAVNLSISYGVRTWQSGRPQPLGACLPPPVYGVFGQDGTYETIYLSDSPYEHRKPRSLEPERGRAVERLIKRVNGLADEQVQRLVVDLLVKYGQAMDTADWRSAFLALWQILEAASLRGKRTEIKAEDIRRRVLSLVRYKPVVRDLLELLIEDRHALVHEGSFSEEGLERVNHLKLIAEHTIAGLLERLRKFPDVRSLEEFYRQAPQSEKALQLRQKVIGEILRK